MNLECLPWGMGSNTVVIPPWIMDRDAWMDMKGHIDHCQETGTKQFFDPQRFNDVRGIGNMIVRRGPFGGGWVTIDYSIEQWSAPVLMLSDYRLRTPCGFSRTSFPGISVAVPAIKRSDKWLEVPIPVAPSPLISLEPTAIKGIDLVVALNGASEDASGKAIVSALRDLGIEAVWKNNLEGIEGGFIRWLSDRKVAMRRLELHDIERFSLRDLYAALIYAGTSLIWKEVPKLFSMHLIGNFTDLPEGHMRLAAFNKLARPFRYPDDW